MSSLRNMINLPAMRAAVRTPAAASLSTGRHLAFSTSPRLGLKESTDKDNVDFDSHKQDSLNKQKQGKGHWKAELASDSEEAVKADRHGESTEQLQQKTKKAAEESAKSGKSTRDHM